MRAFAHHNSHNWLNFVDRLYIPAHFECFAKRQKLIVLGFATETERFPELVLISFVLFGKG